MQNDIIGTAATAAAQIHSVQGTFRDDELVGSEGDDYLYAGKGDDVADGRGGIDTALFYGQYASYTVAQDAASGRWTVQNGRDHATLVNVEFLQFADVRVPVGVASVAKPPPEPAPAAAGNFNDTLVGNELGTVLNGYDGDDTLIGNGGNDTLYGGKGSDTAVFRGVSSDYVVEFDTVRWGYRVVDRVAGRDGSDFVLGIETLQFADTTLNFADLVRNVPVPAPPMVVGLANEVTVTFEYVGVSAGQTMAGVLFATTLFAEEAVCLIGIVETHTDTRFGLEYCAML